jgi:hypothetical protein
MTKLDQAIQLMKTTDQIPGKQTVWEHGVSVRHHILDLMKVLTDPKTTSKVDW